MRGGRTSRSWPGRLALLLMLAWAGTHSVAGSTLIASALALHAHDHLHSLSREGDHVDLVLAHHEPREPGGSDPEPRHDHAAWSLADQDHVVHLASDDAPLSTSRRPSPDTASVPTLPAGLALFTSPSALGPSPAPNARGRDTLKVVVLRL